MRRVLVTGASRGIGRAIARALADAGFAVALNYRSSDGPARELAGEIEAAGGSASLLPFDVADRDAARAALEADLQDNDAFYGVVVNAGVTADAPMAMMKDEDWERVLRTNLDGFYHVVRPLVMPMVRRRDGGRVVAVSSVSGITGNAGQANYAASKAGLIAAARSLALELAKRDITVNSVAPGFIETDMVEGIDAAVIADRVPLRRMGRPEEVASLVRWLFSEDAGYVTGQTFAIDGGLS